MEYVEYIVVVKFEFDLKSMFGVGGADEEDNKTARNMHLIFRLLLEVPRGRRLALLLVVVGVRCSSG